MRKSPLCRGDLSSFFCVTHASGDDLINQTPIARLLGGHEIIPLKRRLNEIYVTHTEETLKLKRRLNEIYVTHTGQDLESVERALERDNFMSP